MSDTWNYIQDLQCQIDALRKENREMLRKLRVTIPQWKMEELRERARRRQETEGAPESGDSDEVEPASAG